MEIEISKINAIKFKVWIDDWDTEFDSFLDARRFCTYMRHNYPKRTSKIEVNLVETLKWDGESGEYKDHLLATIKSWEGENG